MFPSSFVYERPTSFAEAFQLLAEHGDEARPLAGGQSLIPLMKLRVVHPEILIDLQDIPHTRRLAVDDSWITIGALTRHADVEHSRELRTSAPVLAEAMHQLADPQVRELGTVAGALAEADPSGDWGPLLLALGGEIVCSGVRGRRVVPSTGMFTGYLESAVAADELVTEIRIATPPRRSGGAYLKLERRVGDFAVVSAAAQVELDDDGTCRSIGIGLGGVGLVPFKAVAAEESLVGRVPDAAAISEASELVREQISPVTDGRGPGWYKRDMAQVFLRRAVELATRRAAGAADSGGGSSNGEGGAVSAGSAGS